MTTILIYYHRQANGGSEDGTTFPGLGKIDYVLVEDSVRINLVIKQLHQNHICRILVMCAHPPTKMFTLMINLQSMVTSAAVDRNNYGEASDHLPINAVLQM